MSRLIYMDHHATTPVDERVMEAMLPWFTERFGNASGVQHAAGRRARDAVEKARERVARLIGALPEGVVFTGGATESNNLALKGVVLFFRKRNGGKRPRIVTVVTEHPSVLSACLVMEEAGEAEVERLPVGPDGRIDPDRLRAALERETLVVSVMHANNETGVIQPVEEIGRICREKGVLFHSDVVQSAGWMPPDVGLCAMDLVSLSAHKIGGPMGVGALWVRSIDPRVRIVPLLDGGGQEKGLRSGTVPVPLAVGLGTACDIARREAADASVRVGTLRDELWSGMVGVIPGVEMNGSPEHRLPNNLNVAFEDVDAGALLEELDGIALSSGSACSTDRPGPSHVLAGMGWNEVRAAGSVRFGLGRGNTREEVDTVLARLREAVPRIRKRMTG